MYRWTKKWFSIFLNSSGGWLNFFPIICVSAWHVKTLSVFVLFKIDQLWVARCNNTLHTTHPITIIYTIPTMITLKQSDNTKRGPFHFFTARPGCSLTWVTAHPSGHEDKLLGTPSLDCQVTRGRLTCEMNTSSKKEFFFPVLHQTPFHQTHWWVIYCCQYCALTMNAIFAMTGNYI